MTRTISMGKCLNWSYEVLNRSEKGVVIAYLSCNDNGRNNRIYKDLKNIKINMSTENLLIVGDFNGHIGSLGPQPLNANGKKMLKFVDEQDLNILNLDPRCAGEITS